MGRIRDFTQKNIEDILRLLEEETNTQLINDLAGEWSVGALAKELGVPENVVEMAAFFLDTKKRNEVAREKFLQVVEDVRFVDDRYAKIFAADMELMLALAWKIERLASGFSQEVLSKPRYTYDANGNPIKGDDFFSWISGIQEGYDVAYRKHQNAIDAIKFELCLSKYAIMNRDGYMTGIRIDKITEVLKDPSVLEADAAANLLLLWDYVRNNEEAIELGLVDELAPLLSKLSFEYDLVNQYYRSNTTGLQHFLGFTNAFEHEKVQAVMGMDIYWECFEDIPLGDGKVMDLRIWRGGYGFGNSIGVEMAEYVRYDTPNENPIRAAWDAVMYWATSKGPELGFPSDDFKTAARPEDFVKMTVKLYDAETGDLLTYNDNYGQDHYWNITMDSNIYQQRSASLGIDESVVPYTKENTYAEFSIEDPSFDVEEWKRCQKEGIFYMSELENKMDEYKKKKLIDSYHVEYHRDETGEYESIVYFTWSGEGQNAYSE
jgi:hypothetical protein